LTSFLVLMRTPFNCGVGEPIHNLVTKSFDIFVDHVSSKGGSFYLVNLIMNTLYTFIVFIQKEINDKFGMFV
jgi:hypothetical protein